jgi:flavodoxin
MLKLFLIFSAIFSLTLTLTLTLTMGFEGNALAQAPSGQPKILTAYFSRSGNTQTLAREIQKQVGGDIFEITMETPYTGDYDSITQRAKADMNSNVRPALGSAIDNIDTYEVIFLGYPIWWSTMPMVMYTFLETYNLSGKTIIPFCTHGGSGLADSVDNLKKLSPQAKVLEGLAVSGRQAQNSPQEVTAWLKRLGYVK